MSVCHMSACLHVHASARPARARAPAPVRNARCRRRWAAAQCPYILNILSVSPTWPKFLLKIFLDRECYIMYVQRAPRATPLGGGEGGAGPPSPPTLWGRPGAMGTLLREGALVEILDASGRSEWICPQPASWSGLVGVETCPHHAQGQTTLSTHADGLHVRVW